MVFFLLLLLNGQRDITKVTTDYHCECIIVDRTGLFCVVQNHKVNAMYMDDHGKLHLTKEKRLLARVSCQKKI